MNAKLECFKAYLEGYLKESNPDIYNNLISRLDKLFPFEIWEEVFIKDDRTKTFIKGQIALIKADKYSFEYKGSKSEEYYYENDLLKATDENKNLLIEQGYEEIGMF